MRPQLDQQTIALGADAISDLLIQLGIQETGEEGEPIAETLSRAVLLATAGGSNSLSNAELDEQSSDGGLCELSLEAIREYAQRVGEHHSVWDSSGRADVDKLVTSLGGTTTDRYQGTVIKIVKPGQFTIQVSGPASQNRRRFATAHALGQYFLQYLYPKQTGPREIQCWGNEPAEVQANIFASALLMPAMQFTAAYAENQGDTWMMASQFGVSPASVELRAQVLGLTTAPCTGSVEDGLQPCVAEGAGN